MPSLYLYTIQMELRGMRLTTERVTMNAIVNGRDRQQPVKYDTPSGLRVAADLAQQTIVPVLSRGQRRYLLRAVKELETAGIQRKLAIDLIAADYVYYGAVESERVLQRINRQ